MSTTVDILRFYKHLSNQFMVKSKIRFQFWNTNISRDPNFANYTNFQSPEVVDRGSETQFRVAKKKILSSVL